MQGMIEQMRALAVQAGGTPDTTSRVAGTDTFGQALKSSLDRVSDLQHTAGQAAHAFQVGKPGVALYEVMIDQQEAGLAFQMSVQVRNKLVGAYKQVMNMQV